MPSKRSGIPSDDSSPASPTPGDRGRTALWLGLLGIPSFGLTAIAGIVLGLAGLGHRPRGWSIAATLVSLLVLAGWMGALAGALDVMQTHARQPTHHWPAGRILGLRLAEMASRVVDPADPSLPSDEELDALLQRIPDSYRTFGHPPTPLAVEPLRAGPGVFLRCWIGPPLNPEAGSMITAVEPDRRGLFQFAIDGREIWTLARVTDSTRSVFDDRSTEALEATIPAARAIIEAARSAGGELPDAVEASRLVRASGDAPHPRYRRRPGGVFDLEVPGTRRSVSYAAFGGVLVPVLP